MTVDRPTMSGKDSPAVGVDQYRGAALATEHLLGLGHKTVWHLAGPPDWNDSSAREAGWRDTLAAVSADIPPVLRGDWSPASGYEAGRFAARAAGCTAVFAANDHMALGLTRALHEAGLAIPDDVSVVGFDDLPESAYFTPPLTTVHQDFAAVGNAGVSALMAQLRDEGSAAVRADPAALVAPWLVIRDSTGTPR